MKINIICLMLTLCFFYNVFGEAQQENGTVARLESKPDIHNLSRINGVLDISELKEIELVTAEKTQLTGRFGIVVARIEDLVKLPDFISFKPVVVIGKLNYKRNGTSYECYVQWEKVCLLTPAFNKVKLLPKVLVSKFMQSNVEIPIQFHMKAVGDIPSFIQSVRELFSSPVATSADFTDKEKEKIANFQKNTLLADMKPKNDATSRDMERSKPQGSKSLEGKSTHDSDVKRDRNPKDGEPGAKTSGTTNSNSTGGTDGKRKDGVAGLNGDSTAQTGTDSAAGSSEAGGSACREGKPGAMPKTPGADDAIGRDGEGGTNAPKINVPSNGRTGDATDRSGTRGANSTGATNGQAGQNGRTGRNPSGVGSGAEGGRDGRDGTGAPQVRLPGDGRTGDSTARTGANGANGTGATTGQTGQNGRIGSNSSVVGSGAEGGREGRDGAGAQQVRLPGDGRTGDSTAQTGAKGANGAGATNGQVGQNGRTGNNPSVVGSGAEGGRDGRDDTGAPQVRISGAARTGNATDRSGNNANRTGATNRQAGQNDRPTAFGASGWGDQNGNDGNDTPSGGYNYDRELTNTTTYVGARPTANQARIPYNVPEMQLPRVTRNGCTPRVDIDQLRVYEQERLVTMEGGVEVPQPCKDSSTFYTIYKDYNYPYHYDFRQNRAIAKFSYVYTDGNARRKVLPIDRLGGLTEHLDPTRYIIFQETDIGCAPNKKYTDNDVLYEMAKCTKKFFVKTSGETEFVTGCEETNTRARVKTTREGCDIIHNFREGKSYYQSRKVYQFPERALTEYEPCKPEQTPILHIPVKCEPKVEYGMRFDRTRIEINTTEGRKVIRSCQNISANGEPLEKEFCGHFLSNADFSHPYVQKYFMHNGVKKVIPGEEIDYSKSYKHKSTIVSYDNNDVNKTSTPLTDYYFIDDSGKYWSAHRNVRGCPIDYKDTNVTLIRDLASPEIVGCTKTTKRANYRIWKRQDGTEYFEKLAEVSPLIEHVCQTEYVPEDTITTRITYNVSFVVEERGAVFNSRNSVNFDHESLVLNREVTVDEMKSEGFKFTRPSMHSEGIGRRIEANKRDIHGLKVVYSHDEKTYAVSKLNGKIIGRTCVLSRKFDQAINVGRLQ
jgi:hypothetical protein